MRTPRRLGVLLASGAAVAGLLVISPQEVGAASAAVVDVSFGGSFSSGNSYTAATGEVMDGALARRTGGESIDSVSGVVLHGGQEGLTFTPSSPISGGSTQRAFVIEAQFTPSVGQASLGTILAVGGNLFARYRAGSLQYGFSVHSASRWHDATQSVPAPQSGQQHTLSIAYELSPGGAMLHAFLDGKQLPDAVSTAGAATWASPNGNLAGFGNDVHPSGLHRGFAGSLRRVRLATFTGPFTAADLALQQVQIKAAHLRVDFEGTIAADGGYKTEMGEVADGGLTVAGGRVATPGQLHLARRDSGIKWSAAALGADPLGSGLLVETVLAPQVLRPRQQIVDVLGAVSLTALNQHSVRLASATANWDITLPAAQDRDHARYQHLTLAIEPATGNGLQLIVVLGDGTSAGPFDVPAPGAHTQAIRWLSGARGIVYGVAATTFNGLAPVDARVLDALPCIAAKYAPAQQIAIMPGECLTSLVAKASALRPSQRQQSWQELGQTAFLHFGMNTFTGAEWGTGKENPDLFQPKHLDTDQWARTLKAAGFRLTILVVKHHDGFVLYPSRYTTHDVAGSSWENGKGDVLRDFANSMHQYGLKVGVYMSPADENQYYNGVYADNSPHIAHTIPTLVRGDDRAPAVADGELPTLHLTADDYGAYMLNQLYEVLTQYGPIDEVWFDGAEGRIPSNKVEHYDFPSWYKLIRALQPQAVIAVTGPDVRWAGNERGVARVNEWSVLPTVTAATGAPDYALSSAAQDEGGRPALLAGRDAGATQLSWWPAECDVSLHSGWFWHPGQLPKSDAKLAQIYYDCVGRNGVLLLNVPPNREGVISDYDVTALQQWRARLEHDMPTDLAIGAGVSGDGADPKALVDGKLCTDWVTHDRNTGSVTLSFAKPTTIDRFALAEDTRFGQQVESAVLETENPDGSWSQVAQIGTVGYQRIVALAQPVTAQRFRLRILKSRAAVHLERISLFRHA